MLKEKIKEFTKGEGNNKKKIENLIFLIVILSVTIILINFILKEDKQSEKDKNQEISTKTLAAVTEKQDTENSNDLQKQLEKILSTIKGVGKVNVFISYSESSKTIAMYDEKITTSSTEETDSSRRT